MIRLANHNDRQSIKQIWNLSFGDSYDFIDDFLDRYASAEGLVYEEDSVIQSMLMLLSVDYHIDNKILPCWYVYACATLPQYRNKGLMEKLLDAADELAQERNRHALILKPASDRLKVYYERCGFETFSKMRYLTLTAKMQLEHIDFMDVTIDEMMDIRRRYFGNGLVEVKKEHLEIEREMMISEGGGFFGFRSNDFGGYLVMAPSGREMRVGEVAGNKNNLELNDYQYIADNIGSHFGCETVRFLIKESKASPLSQYLFRSKKITYRPENYFNFDLG